MDACMHACMDGQMDVWMHACVRACVRACMHAACIHTCMRACMCAYFFKTHQIPKKNRAVFDGESFCLNRTAIRFSIKNGATLYQN